MELVKCFEQHHEMFKVSVITAVTCFIYLLTTEFYETTRARWRIKITYISPPLIEHHAKRARWRIKHKHHHHHHRSSHLAAHSTLILPFCLHVHDRVHAAMHGQLSRTKLWLAALWLRLTLSLSSHVRASKRCGHHQYAFHGDRVLDPQDLHSTALLLHNLC